MVDSHWALAVAEHEILFNGNDWLGRAWHRSGHIDPAQTVRCLADREHDI
jgi:hypothetical protein